MAKVGVRLKIDVSKIDKASLFRGKKGVYLDATAFIDLDQLDQYNNSGMITQDLSKERSQGGEKGPILGNSQVFWKDDQQQGYQGNPLPSQQQPNQAVPQYQASNQMQQPASQFVHAFYRL